MCSTLGRSLWFANTETKLKCVRVFVAIWFPSPLWFDENAFGAPIYTPDLQIEALNKKLIAYEKIQRYEFVLEFGIYVARRISIANASRLEENIIGFRPRRDF